MTTSPIDSAVSSTDILAKVSVAPLQELGTEKPTLRVGVVGYSNQGFDREVALGLIQKAFDSFDTTASIEIVSGLTDLGIPALAYEEAVRRGWQTMGIACSQAYNYQWFPVDNIIIRGNNWGDESPIFLQVIDLLVRIGGGVQSHFEASSAKLDGKQVIEFDLPALLSA